MTRKASYRYLPSRHVPKVNGYLARRNEPSPSGRRLAGMTERQSNVFRRIQRLEREIIETISYHTVADNAIRIAEIERLIAAHFADDWARLQAARQPIPMELDTTEVATEQRALAS